MYCGFGDTQQPISSCYLIAHACSAHAPCFRFKPLAPSGHSIFRCPSTSLSGGTHPRQPPTVSVKWLIMALAPQPWQAPPCGRPSGAPGSNFPPSSQILRVFSLAFTSFATKNYSFPPGSSLVPTLTTQ